MGLYVGHAATLKPRMVFLCQVLEAAGITDPKLLAVVYTARARSVAAVRNLREKFRDTPIYARALDSLHAAELKVAGASSVITANTEVATEMGSQILYDLGASASGVRPHPLHCCVVVLLRALTSKMPGLIEKS